MQLDKTVALIFNCKTVQSLFRLLAHAGAAFRQTKLRNKIWTCFTV